MFIEKLINAMWIFVSICIALVIIILSVYFIEKCLALREEDKNRRMRPEKELKNVSFEGPTRWELNQMVSTIRKNERKYLRNTTRYRSYKFR